MTKPRLKAFVAMAFGYKDTDGVFDSAVRPTLRAAGITAIRVDKIEHNEEIDDRIIKELNDADLLIADLTYARPSVYFEAGYGQRKVPVIYTCRRDHFRPRHDDPHGNYRVHFDLQMKNIIAWRDPRDTTFQKRLAKRIAHVTRPLLAQREKQVEERNRRKEFDSLATRTKVTRLMETGIPVAERFGFRGDLITSESSRHWYRVQERHLYDSNLHRRVIQLAQVKPAWIGVRFSSGILKLFLLMTPPSFTKKDVTALEGAVFGLPAYDLNPSGRQQPIQQIFETVVVVPLRRCPLSRVADVLVDFDLDGDRFFRRDSQPLLIGPMFSTELVFQTHGWSKGSRFVTRGPKRGARGEYESDEYLVRERKVIGENPRGLRVKVAKRTSQLHLWSEVIDLDLEVRLSRLLRN